jgi:hypothetical protein
MSQTQQVEKQEKVKRKLTSQHLAGRLDNAKNKGLAFFIMDDLRRQI